MALLRMENMVKAFDKRAVDDVSFELKGRNSRLLGENGAGKAR